MFDFKNVSLVAMFPGQFKRIRKGPEPGNIRLIHKFIILLHQRALAAEQTVDERCLGF